MTVPGLIGTVPSGTLLLPQPTSGLEVSVLCAKPIYSVGPTPVGCGQCMNCRVNKRRQWTARILLEGLSCEAWGGEVSWTTLTYADENIPMASRGVDGTPVRSLSGSDYQYCFKRLRRSLGSFRFCLVGEYGDQTWRPHYHALLFGPPVLAVERSLREDWEPRFGHTRTRPWAMPDSTVTGREGFDTKTARAAYCASYVTKKMTAIDDERLGPCRMPEFWRSSRKPGIGMVKKLVDLHHTSGGALFLAKSGDVRRTVRINGKVWPLAPKVRSWLREELGIPATREERLELLPDAEDERCEPSAIDYARAAAHNAKLLRRATKGTL